MNPAPQPYVQPGGVVYPGNNVIAAPNTVTQVQVHRPAWSTSKGLARGILWMGVLQLALGVASIIFNMGGNIQNVYYLFVGPGYWCGIPYIICGVMGIVGGVRRSKGFIIAFLVLSIVSTVLTIGIIATTAAGLADYQYLCNDYYGYSYYYSCSNPGATVAWNALLLVAGLTEFIISIVSACLCCGALCCCKENHPGQVQYVSGTAHVVMGGQLQPTTFASQPIQYTGQPVVNSPVIVAGQPGPTGQIMFQGAQQPAHQFQQPAPMGSAPPYQQAHAQHPPPYAPKPDPTNAPPDGPNEYEELKY